MFQSVKALQLAIFAAISSSAIPRRLESPVVALEIAAKIAAKIASVKRAFRLLKRNLKNLKITRDDF